MSELRDDLARGKLHMGLARYPVCFGEQQLNAVQPHFKRLSSILFFWLLRSTLPLTPEFCKRLLGGGELGLWGFGTYKNTGKLSLRWDRIE